MHIYQIDGGLSHKTEHYTKKYGDTVKMHLFFFFFSLWKLEYKVDPSSPESSIHNEWLVTVMYAAAESCSACSRPCLRLGWDHNEAIFVTDFRTCWGSRCCSRCGGPGGSAWVMVGSPRPHWASPTQSHHPSVTNAPERHVPSFQ